MKKHGGFLVMLMMVLAIVLFCSFFEYIMVALEDILALELTNMLVLELLVQIAPTILLLGGLGVLGYTGLKGYQATSVKDSNGLMRMVFAVLLLIVFLTIFTNIVEAFVDLYDVYGVDPTWIAFGIICQIMPAILFIGGIFAMVGSGVGGVKARRSRRALA